MKSCCHLSHVWTVCSQALVLVPEKQHQMGKKTKNTPNQIHHPSKTKATRKTHSKYHKWFIWDGETKSPTLWLLSQGTWGERMQWRVMCSPFVGFAPVGKCKNKSFILSEVYFTSEAMSSSPRHCLSFSFCSRSHISGSSWARLSWPVHGRSSSTAWVAAEDCWPRTLRHTGARWHSGYWQRESSREG